MAPIVASAALEVAGQRWRELTGAATAARARGHFRDWCLASVRRLGLDVRVHGSAPTSPCVYVANHRSYLDVALLGAVLDAAFLSRADVAEWPLVGRAARAIGTVFIDRDTPGARAAAARALARRLREASVVVFPEGTTGAAAVPADFFPGLFRLVHRLRVSVVPVTIRYSDRRAYWVRAHGIADHLREVLRPRGLLAAVHIGPVLAPAADAAALAAAAHAAVSAPLVLHGELLQVDGDR